MGTLESFLKKSTSLTLSVMMGGVMLQGRLTELPWTALIRGTFSASEQGEGKTLIPLFCFHLYRFSGLGREISPGLVFPFPGFGTTLERKKSGTDSAGFPG